MFTRTSNVPRRAAGASSLRALIAAACLCLLATSGAAYGERASALATCAMRDTAVITEIEDHGEARTVSGETLLEAFVTLMRARDVCHEGRLDAAEALYDSAMALLRAASKGQ
jgi:hypothetical protein